jgi:uncharacterized spore protein YtfJ
LAHSAAQEPGAVARNKGLMDVGELTKGVREALSVRQVFGEPVEREGVTVIPAATIVGGGGGGAGETTGKPSKEGSKANAQTQGGGGSGFGGFMWPAGAFEIRDDGVTWRPAIDVTRVLVMALILAIALVRALGRRQR